MRAPSITAQPHDGRLERSRRALATACACRRTAHRGPLGWAVLVELARNYVEAMNAGSVPTIRTAWENVVEVENQHLISRVLEVYKEACVARSRPLPTTSAHAAGPIGMSNSPGVPASQRQRPSGSLHAFLRERTVAEADEVEVAGGDAGDREDRVAGEGLGPREAGEVGRERRRRRRREGGGCLAELLRAVIRVEAVVVVFVLGREGRAVASSSPLFSLPSAAKPAAAREEAASVAVCSASAAAAEQLAGAAVPRAGWCIFFCGNFSGEKKSGKKVSLSLFFPSFPLPTPLSLSLSKEEE